MAGLRDLHGRTFDLTDRARCRFASCLRHRVPRRNQHGAAFAGVGALDAQRLLDVRD
jgi:hypothetical protein